jgi:hypothetical protein
MKLSTHFHRVSKLECTKLYLHPPHTSSQCGAQLTTGTPSPYFVCCVGTSDSTSDKRFSVAFEARSFNFLLTW